MDEIKKETAPEVPVQEQQMIIKIDGKSIFKCITSYLTNYGNVSEVQ